MLSWVDDRINIINVSNQINNHFMYNYFKVFYFSTVHSYAIKIKTMVFFVSAGCSIFITNKDKHWFNNVLLA